MPNNMNNGNNGKKSNNTVLIIIFAIIFVVVGLIILFVAIFLITSASSKKLVCESDEGNITIMYNDKTITGYTAANGLSYDLDGQKKYAEQIGIDAYMEEFSTWFKNNTTGTCNIDGNEVSTDTTSDKDEDVNNNEQTQYKVGDAVKLLDDSDWHIISIDGDNVTLLSDTLAKESSGYGVSATAEDQKYENSIIKEYLEDTYLPTLKSGLSSNGGNITNLKVRLITADEFLSLSDSEFYVSPDKTISTCWSTSGKYYDLSDEDYSNIPSSSSFLVMTPSYWTMTNYRDYAYNNPKCDQQYVSKDSGYYGAYYVEVSPSTFDENAGHVGLDMDINAIGGWASYGTSLGIRPVIETTVKNIK